MIVRLDVVLNKIKFKTKLLLSTFKTLFVHVFSVNIFSVTECLNYLNVNMILKQEVKWPKR